MIIAAFLLSRWSGFSGPKEDGQVKRSGMATGRRTWCSCRLTADGCLSRYCLTRKKLRVSEFCD